MPTNAQVIERLKELKDQIPGIKSKGVEYLDSAEFKAWRDKVVKWLKLGFPHTHDEHEKFTDLHFQIFRMRGFGEERYDYDDLETYKHDCDLAVTILDSAIENIEMDLVPETPQESNTGKKRSSGSKFGGVNIAQAGTVVMGDKNIVAKIDSITVSDFLKVLESQIQEQVQDPQQKATLLQKIEDISRNPAANTVLGQTLGHILRVLMGQ